MGIFSLNRKRYIAWTQATRLKLLWKYTVTIKKMVNWPKLATLQWTKNRDKDSTCTCSTILGVTKITKRTSLAVWPCNMVLNSELSTLYQAIIHFKRIEIYFYSDLLKANICLLPPALEKHKKVIWFIGRRHLSKVTNFEKTYNLYFSSYKRLHRAPCNVNCMKWQTISDMRRYIV